MFIAALFLIHANVENGMNDDWSFIRTARDLAQTGHLRYNGWSAPLIGFQAYWGALFVKLFGFSFTVVRASTWVLTLSSIPVLWSLFRNVVADENQAFFGVIAFLFSPLILPNIATYMTDMPAFLLFAAALLCAMKAWASKSDSAAMLWTLGVTAFAFLSGSVRQIYWVSGICFLAVLGWKRFSTIRGRVFVGGCLLLTVVLAASASHWLGQQPYVPADTTMDNLHDLSWQEIMGNSSGDLARDLLGVAVLLIPFSLILAVKEVRRIPVWVQVLMVLAALGITHGLRQPMPWLGNTITKYGVISPRTVVYGEKPEILSKHVMLLLGTIGLSSFALAIAALIRRFRTQGASHFEMLAVPFAFVYIAVLAYRATSFGLFDRYMIPIFFLALTMILSAARNIGRVGLAAAFVFTIYAVATTHDYFAEAGAKLEATREIMQAGNPRNTISGGFEFDAWTQTDLTGHVNNEAVDYPDDAYRETDDCNGPPDTQVFWREETPDVKAKYVLSLTPLVNLQASHFTPVKYRRWLPWATSFIYIETADPPLNCPIKN